MRFLFRADAGVVQGTGHVMRCLTLADEFARRGHEVALMTGPISVGWLADAIREAGIPAHECELDALPLERVRALQPDWLIVDSYRIEPTEISAAAQHVSVLAIVDGDDRGIDAAVYLDQNLGADSVHRSPKVQARILAGSQYALVRRAVLEAKRNDPWRFGSERPSVLCFMGGTDATASAVGAAAAVAQLKREIDLIVVAPLVHHDAVRALVQPPTRLRLLAPTPDLPALLAASDIVVSATGTSAWDICALGIPAVFVAVVDNQRASLRELVTGGLALGIDVIDSGSEGLAAIGDHVASLLDDEELRQRLSSSSLAAFDGDGSRRVAEWLENGHAGKSSRVVTS